MKAPNSFKIVVFSTALFLANNAQAQTSKTILHQDETSNKIFVNLKITPTIKQFHATLQPLDSVQHKIRLVVNNAEERKCTISINSTVGYLWSTQIKEPYYNQVFDLSLLDDGDYFIKIITGKEYFVKKITLSTNSYVQRHLSIE